MAKKMYCTHTVFKDADAEKYLTEDQQADLKTLLCEIDAGRINDGKKVPNSYHICNHDEPYADKVLQVILDGEDRKTGIINKPAQTCDHCNHAKWFEDRSVGIFGGYECDNPEMPEDQYDTYCSDTREDCPYFSPRIIKKCGKCQREMNVPEWLWTIYYHGAYGDCPCCSEDCVAEMKKGEEELMKSMGDL